MEYLDYWHVSNCPHAYIYIYMCICVYIYIYICSRHLHSDSVIVILAIWILTCVDTTAYCVLVESKSCCNLMTRNNLSNPPVHGSHGFLWMFIEPNEFGIRRTNAAKNQIFIVVKVDRCVAILNDNIRTYEWMEEEAKYKRGHGFVVFHPGVCFFNN